MKKILLIALVLIAAGSNTLRAQTAEHNMKEWLPVERDAKTAVWTELDGVRIPIPPLEHPRLYVRVEDIPALKAENGTSYGQRNTQEAPQGFRAPQ